jgi:hypothetical protein
MQRRALLLTESKFRPMPTAPQRRRACPLAVKTTQAWLSAVKRKRVLPLAVLKRYTH